MFRKAHLLGKILNNTVFRHLGANGKAALELLLDAAQHLLVLLGSEALHSCESAIRNLVLENPVHLYWAQAPTGLCSTKTCDQGTTEALCQSHLQDRKD